MSMNLKPKPQTLNTILKITRTTHLHPPMPQILLPCHRSSTHNQIHWFVFCMSCLVPCSDIFCLAAVFFCFFIRFENKTWGAPCLHRKRCEALYVFSALATRFFLGPLLSPKRSPSRESVRTMWVYIVLINGCNVVSCYFVFQRMNKLVFLKQNKNSQIRHEPNAWPTNRFYSSGANLFGINDLNIFVSPNRPAFVPEF